MLMNDKLVKRAETFVKGHKPDDVHPDVAALMASFERVRDGGATDMVVQAHARSLVQLVDALGVEDEKPAAPAKKAAARGGRKRR